MGESDSNCSFVRDTGDRGLVVWWYFRSLLLLLLFFVDLKQSHCICTKKERNRKRKDNILAKITLFTVLLFIIFLCDECDCLFVILIAYFLFFSFFFSRLYSMLQQMKKKSCNIKACSFIFFYNIFIIIS